MSEKEISIGIIGLGGRCQALFPLLAQQSDKVEITAICDISQKSIDAFCEKVPNQAKVYDSAESLCESEDVDWVFIASMNRCHKEQIVSAFRNDKHVFCEKPICTREEDVLEILEAWRNSSSNLMMGYTLRYSPHYHKLKEIIDSGRIGEVISMEFNEVLTAWHGTHIMGGWRRLEDNSGGHLLEKCSHDLDIANWLTKSLPQRVASFGGNDFFTPNNAGRIDEIKSPDGKKMYVMAERENPFLAQKTVIDNQVAIMEYQNGVRATFHTNLNGAITERRMYILGSKGTIRSDVRTGVIEVQEIGFDQEIVREDSGSSGLHGGGDEIIMRELLEAMENPGLKKAGVMEGLNSALVAFAIEKARKQGQVVDLGEIWQSYANFES